MASSLPCTTTGIPAQRGSQSGARAAGAGQHGQPSCGSGGGSGASSRAGEACWHLHQPRLSCSCCGKGSRETQPLSAGKQEGLCLSQNSPQPQATPRTHGGQQPALLTKGPGPPSPSRAGTEQQHAISLPSPRRQATSCTHPQTAPSSARAGASPPGCTAPPRCCCCWC